MAIRFGSARTDERRVGKEHPAAVTGAFGRTFTVVSPVARFVQCSVLLFSVHTAVAGVTLPGTISQVSAPPSVGSGSSSTPFVAVPVNVAVIVNSGWSPVLYVPASGVLTTFTSAHV